MFHPYEPSLASAAVDGSLCGLVCFLMLAGLLWLGRWVVGIFASEESTEEDDRP